MIHHFIGQINSNKGRFDRKSIKRSRTFFSYSPSPFCASMYSKTFLNSAPRLGCFQEPEETHLELASFDSALTGDFPFTCFNWHRNGPFKVHQDNHELWKLQKKRGLLRPIAREKTDLISLHSTAFLPFLCNLV